MRAGIFVLYEGYDKVQRANDAAEIEAEARELEASITRHADEYALYQRRVAAARRAVGGAPAKK